VNGVIQCLSKTNSPENNVPIPKELDFLVMNVKQMIKKCHLFEDAITTIPPVLSQKSVEVFSLNSLGNINIKFEAYLAQNGLVSVRITISWSTVSNPQDVSRN
jgi:hypothetical protein